MRLGAGGGRNLERGRRQRGGGLEALLGRSARRAEARVSHTGGDLFRPSLSNCKNLILRLLSTEVCSTYADKPNKEQVANHQTLPRDLEPF